MLPFLMKIFLLDYYPEDGAAEEPSKFEKWLDEKLGNEKVEKLVIGFSVVLAVCFSAKRHFSPETGRKPPCSPESPPRSPPA